jgi:hypothetical protein
MNRLILKLLHVIIPLKHETDVIYETKVCPQHYVIKFVSDLQQVNGFLRVFGFFHQYHLPPQYYRNIVVLLKMALNTIALTPTQISQCRQKLNFLLVRY